MKFGIQHPNFSFDGEGSQIPENLGRLARKAEEIGMDSFWLMDHLHQIPMVGGVEEPMLEGWTTISVLAGMTSKIKLGTMVTANTYRHPAVLAKMGATLDVMSSGRLFMGIGAAWNVEEATAYGIPFPPTRERLERLDEAVQIIRKMWTEEESSFDGKYYRIKDAYCNPKPAQKPTPKILIGGTGENILLKIVANHGDACNLFGSPKTVKRKLDALREHCKTVGRDYDAILKTKLSRIRVAEDKSSIEKSLRGVPEDLLNEEMIYGSPEEVTSQVEEFRQVGIQYLIMSFTPGSELDSLSLFGKKVMPNF